MFYSPSQRLALARFPKTAGSSLTTWFLEAFPDTVSADPNDPHVPVVDSLRRLGLIARRSRSSWRRLLTAPFAGRRKTPPLHEGLLIIGVLRDPFEVLVSLYSYWRRRASFEYHAPGSIGHVATTQSFREFVVRAVVDERLPRYEKFFGVGSEAWPATKLLDFRHLEPGLREVCRDHGIEPPVSLPKANVAPQVHDYEACRDEVTDLLPAIRSRFRWYYEEAQSIMVRGDAAAMGREAA
jgi:hypothetical protein